MSTQRGILVAALVLVACPKWGRAADDAIAERLSAITAAQKAAREQYSRDLKQAGPDDAAQQPITDAFLKVLARNVEAALDLARENPGSPASFDALKFVIKTNRAGPGDPTARALRLILERGDDRRPGQDDYLAHVALLLFQYPDGELLLRRVLDRNPNRDDRAAACYWLSRYLRHQAKIVRRLRQKPDDQKVYERYVAAAPIGKLVKEKDPDAGDRESGAFLERCASEFGDVQLRGYTRPLREIVGGELFALRNLGIGKVAPEIEGADHEGKSFRLSDTRGKVVVLTFSGNWCGPCVGMYPQERALQAKLAGKPFVLVSVNTDKEVATLTKSIASGEITWRCWWDGEEGPIAVRWGVDSFPSIFVLDRRGVIRFKDVRGDDLDRAVMDLLGEADAAARPD